MKEERTLTLITEGHLARIDYYVNNKIYCKNYITDLGKCETVFPFLNKQDDILVVINSLTDFTVADVFSLIKSAKNENLTYGNFTLMSNLYFENLDMPYYLYTGDLITGNILEVTPKTSKKEVNAFLKNEVKNKKDFKNKLPNKKKVNAIMKRYLNYNVSKVQFFLKEKNDLEIKDFIGASESNLEIKLSKIFEEH